MRQEVKANPKPVQKTLSFSHTEMVSDKVYEFFLVCTPGLEDAVQLELKRWRLELNDRRELGGVLVSASLSQGFALNEILKAPTRILLRLADFGCRDFPKLFKKISAFPWENWIPDDKQIEFSATTHGSWLKIKKRIEETCADGRKARLKARSMPAPSGVSLSVFVRFVDDICTVSLDTSGEILHKRHLRPMTAAAPLRETTAASLLLLMEKFSPSGSYELVDPMTGGGTFLLEGAILNRRLTSRPFAFQQLTKKTVLSEMAPPAGPQFSRLIGFDSDMKTLMAAKENLERSAPGIPLDLINGDVMKSEPLPENTQRWLIANPPYGERLNVRGGLREFYQNLFAATEKLVRPSLSCFLLPEKVEPASLKRPQSWRLLEERRFLNGGIPVVALFFAT